MVNLRSRAVTGPLNQRQKDVLDHVSRGMTHQQTANALGVTRVCVSENMCVAVAKMGVENSWEAVGRWTRRRAFLDAAEMMGRAKIHRPNGDVEEHVNHVIDGLVQLLRDRAERLLPQ